MKTKPIYFTFVSAYFLLVALALPIQVFVLYDYSLAEVDSVLTQLTLVNWLVISLCGFASYSVWTVHSKLNFTLAVTCLIVFANNFLVGLAEVDYSMDQALLASGLFVVPVLPLAMGRFQAVLKQRQLQWWRTARRYVKSLTVDIIANDGEVHVSAKTINVSISGALLEVPKGSIVRPQVPLAIYSNEREYFVCEARVVRREDGSRSGFELVGVEFISPHHEKIEQFRRSLEISA